MQDRVSIHSVPGDGSCFFYALYHVSRERGLLKDVASCFVTANGPSCWDIIAGMSETQGHVGLPGGPAMGEHEQCRIFTMCARGCLSHMLSLPGRLHMNRIDGLYEQLKTLEGMGMLRKGFQNVPVHAQREFRKGVSKDAFKKYYIDMILNGRSFAGQVEIDETVALLLKCSIVLRPNTVKDRWRLQANDEKYDQALVASYASSQPREICVVASADHFWYVRDARYMPLSLWPAKQKEIENSLRLMEHQRRSSNGGAYRKSRY